MIGGDRSGEQLFRDAEDICEPLVVSSTLTSSANDVEVSTTGSKVTLRGSGERTREGRSPGDRRRDEGATDVDDQLGVRSESCVTRSRERGRMS